mgnify:CR=1 FL=1
MDQQSLTGKLQIRALDIQVMYSLLHTCALVSSISRIVLIFHLKMNTNVNSKYFFKVIFNKVITETALPCPGCF